MIDLLCCFRRRDHPIRLNSQFHLDLQWWHKFLSDWHGVSFWLFPGLSPAADIELSSDAAGSLGYGAFLERPLVHEFVVPSPSTAIHCLEGTVPCGHCGSHLGTHVVSEACLVSLGQ